MRSFAAVLLFVLAFAGASACTRVPVDLLTVTNVGTTRVEQDGRFVVLGGGFPTGRDGRVRIFGELRRNGEVVPVEVSRAIHATNPLSAELLVDEEFVAALHGSFAGSVEVIFESAPGMPVARGLREGVTFEVARPAVEEMQGDIERMRHAAERLAALGLTVSEQDARVRVDAVRAGSIAEAAGIRAGDVLKKMDDLAIRSAEDFGRDAASTATSMTVAREGRGLLRLAMRAGSSQKALSRTDARGVLLMALIWLAFLAATTGLGRVFVPLVHATRRAERKLAVALRRPARVLREIAPAFCVMTVGLLARSLVEISPLTVAVALSAIVLSVQVSMRGASLRTTLAKTSAFLLSVMSCVVLAGDGSFELPSDAPHATEWSPWFASSPAHWLAAFALFASVTSLRARHAAASLGARHTAAVALFQGLGALVILPVVLSVGAQHSPTDLIFGAGVVAALSLFARPQEARMRTVLALAALSLAASLGMLFVELDAALAHDLAWATLGVSLLAAAAFVARLIRRSWTALLRRIRGAAFPREVVSP